MRLIDGDALFDKIYEAFGDDIDGGMANLFMGWINEAPTLTPQNEWVSMEEKLPEDNTQVLMWSARWEIAEAGSYYNQHFWVYSEIGDVYIDKDITYWMELPAPPDRRPPEGEEGDANRG